MKVTDSSKNSNKILKIVTIFMEEVKECSMRLATKFGVIILDSNVDLLK